MEDPEPDARALGARVDLDEVHAGERARPVPGPAAPCGDVTQRVGGPLLCRPARDRPRGHPDADGQRDHGEDHAHG